MHGLCFVFHNHMGEIMTDDLVKRLRLIGTRVGVTNRMRDAVAGREAADRIEKLEAALAKIAQHDMQAIAIDALRPGERIRKALDAK